MPIEDKTSKSFLQEVFHTVLEVIEVKPSFNLSKQLDCILITINIFQISGYIFCTGYPKPYLDEKIITIARVNEVAPGTFLLLMKSEDTFTKVMFVLIQLVIYSYYGYIFCLSYIKNRKQNFYEKHRKIFMNVNSVLIMFFTVYYWIFLTPFTEISLGMLSCNQFAFLYEYRDQGDCNDKPIIWRILGVIGVILSVITNLMILFFFRNYEFQEKNLLKRKFAISQIPICLAFFSLQFFYYIKDLFPSLKFICAQIMGFSMAFDILVNYPFRDKTISAFYILGISYFWVSHSLIPFWLYTDSFDGWQLTFTFTFLTGFLVFFLISFQSYQYENLLRFSSKNFYKYYNRVDFFVEELLRFAQQSLRDEESKFKIFELVVYHKGECTNILCVCKYKGFRNHKNQIDQDFILELIDCIMRDSMNKREISSNENDFEHLFLKYITFVARFCNNPVRAYYELKHFTSIRRKLISSYCNVITQVLSSSFEHLIITNQKSKYVSSALNSSKLKSQLSIDSIIKTEMIKAKSIDLLSSFLTEKIGFWDKVKEGFDQLDDFAELSLRFSAKIKVIKQKFNLILESPEFQQIAPNVIIFKIISIYRCFVTNEIKKAFEIELQFQEMKKKDFQKPSYLIHSMNLLNGNIQVFQISLCKDKGKITNKLTSMNAAFFGYASNEIDQLLNIKQLQPHHISQIHDQIVDNYIDRGHSSLIEQGYLTFALDRNGFIFPISLNISSVFGIQDDFRINALLLKHVSEKHYLLVSSTGNNMGMSSSLLHALLFQFSPLFDRKDEFDGKITNQFSKVNVFLFLPKLIKILQSFPLEYSYFNKSKDERNENDSESNNTQEKQMNKQKSRVLIKQQKALLKIPCNILDLHTTLQEYLQQNEDQLKENDQDQFILNSKPINSGTIYKLNANENSQKLENLKVNLSKSVQIKSEQVNEGNKNGFSAENTPQEDQKQKVRYSKRKRSRRLNSQRRTRLFNQNLLDIFSEFIETNQLEWERDKCVSTLEVTVNVSIDIVNYSAYQPNSGQKVVSSSKTIKVELYDFKLPEYNEQIYNDLKSIKGNGSQCNSSQSNMTSNIQSNRVIKISPYKDINNLNLLGSQKSPNNIGDQTPKMKASQQLASYIDDGVTKESSSSLVMIQTFLAPNIANNTCKEETPALQINKLKCLSKDSKDEQLSKIQLGISQDFPLLSSSVSQILQLNQFSQLQSPMNQCDDNVQLVERIGQENNNAQISSNKMEHFQEEDKYCSFQSFENEFSLTGIALKNRGASTLRKELKQQVQPSVLIQRRFNQNFYNELVRIKQIKDSFQEQEDEKMRQDQYEKYQMENEKQQILNHQQNKQNLKVITKEKKYFKKMEKINRVTTKIQYDKDENNNCQQSISSLNQTVRNIDNSSINKLANKKRFSQSQVINLLLSKALFKYY